MGGDSRIPAYNELLSPAGFGRLAAAVFRAGCDRIYFYTHKRGDVCFHRHICELPYAYYFCGRNAVVWNVVFGDSRGRFPAESTGALSWLGPAVSYVDTFKHLDEFTGALLDTRPFFFYLSTAAVFVAFTSLITESKNA